ALHLDALEALQVSLGVLPRVVTEDDGQPAGEVLLRVPDRAVLDVSDDVLLGLRRVLRRPRDDGPARVEGLALVDAIDRALAAYDRAVPDRERARVVEDRAAARAARRDLVPEVPRADRADRREVRGRRDDPHLRELPRP